MNDSSKQRPTEAPQRGDAAWKAAKDAIAKRNEQARKAGMVQRQKQDEAYFAGRRDAELREQADLAKRRS
jgi:hypothetical protein